MGKMMLNSHKVGMLFHLLTQASKLNALLTPLASRQDELVAGKTLTLTAKAGAGGGNAPTRQAGKADLLLQARGAA